MRRSLTPFFALFVTLCACEGFKEAMTAHVDVAAKAGSQELSVDRLGTLLSESKAPVNQEVAKAVTDLWVNYQLLGSAAAHSDSLKDPKLLNDALWPIIAQERVVKWHDQISKKFPGIDTAAIAARYTQGELLAAQHILLLVPATATPTQRDSIHSAAEAIHAKATSANFAELAKKSSQDPSSAARGGSLGVFPKGMMVPEFQNAVEKLKPGEISPVVKSQFGYHIIRRSTFPEVKDEFVRAASSQTIREQDSLYLTRLETAGKVQLKDNAVATVKSAAKDLDAHAKDNTVIATSTAGDFTVSRMVRWISAYPQKEQIEQGLQAAPDSQVIKFVKNVIRNELVLHQADSAHVQLDSTEVQQLHNRFTQFVGETWNRLGIAPKMLADSGSTVAQRERVASAHIDQYLEKLMKNQASFVSIPDPIAALLREKFTWKVNSAGVQRAIEHAAKVRAASDSERVKNRPPSEVPMGPPQPKPSAKQPR